MILSRQFEMRRQLERYLADRIGRRKWSDDDVRKYVGRFKAAYLSYAADGELRRWAASGGATTAILLYLLETGAIDGAMVLRGWVDDDGGIKAGFEIASSREQLLAAQGSKYQAVRFGTRELRLIDSFPGRLAVVLLPCDASKLARARSRRPEIDSKIRLVVSLYCGHNSEPELAEGVARRIGQRHGRLVDFHYRSGHWRGVLTARYTDGTALEVHHNEFKNFHNLYFYAQPKCNHCSDHFGYEADISVGDIWTLAMREHPIKHTAIIARSDQGDEAVRESRDGGAIVLEPTDIRNILDGQSRILPTHYNISARAKAGKLLGYTIRDTVHERVGPVAFLVAFLVLLNQRVSRSAIGRRLILALPTPIARGYLLLLKALEQL